LKTWVFIALVYAGKNKSENFRKITFFCSLHLGHDMVSEDVSPYKSELPILMRGIHACFDVFDAHFDVFTHF